MGWLIVSIIAIGTAVSMRLSFFAFGTWFSPLTHYMARWLFLVFLFQLNLMNYTPISVMTWSVIALSIFSFFVGSAMPMLITCRRKKIEVTHIKTSLRSSVSPKRLRTGILVLFSIGCVFFAVYIRNMPGSPNPFEALSMLSELRAIMKEEPIPGFHYFYFMELVVYLCFVHFLLWPKSAAYWIYLVGLLALFSLLYTTGKVNVAKSIMWCFFALLYLEIYRLGSIRMLKWLAGLTGIGAMVFALMVTNEGSDLASMRDAGDSNATFLLAYLYMSVPVGVLDKLLADPEVVPVYGAYMFGPVLKLLNVVGIPVEVPSHIGDFYNTPFPANIATYIDLMYKDFGLIGPSLIPFFIGFICSYFFSRLRLDRVSLFTFSFNTILALSVFGSTGAANYMKPSYWFQILVLLLLSRYVLNSERKSGTAYIGAPSHENLCQGGMK